MGIGDWGIGIAWGPKQPNILKKKTVMHFIKYLKYDPLF